MVRLDDDEPGSEETRADNDDTGQGAGGSSGAASLEAASQGEVAATTDGKRTRQEDSGIGGGGDGDAEEQEAKRPRGARGARPNNRQRRGMAKARRRDGLDVGAE